MKLYLIIAAEFLLLSTALAQAPETISYQGVLTDAQGNAVSDGSYSLTFNLYESAAGGSSIWGETQKIDVTNGVFNAILGSVKPLSNSFDRPYWLGIAIGSDPELEPRIELTASAYSLNARSVADSSVTGESIVEGQIVRSLNGVTDEVVLSAGENINLSVDGQTVTISASGQVAESRNTLDAADGDPGDAVFVDEDGNVGIGTAEPDALLEIRANSPGERGIRIRNDDSGPISLRFNEGPPSRATLVYLFDKDEFLIKAIEQGSKLRLLATNDEGITIDSSGNVGMGTTSPSEQLEITGNFMLPSTSASAGIIKSGGDRFIHNFGDENFFAGVNAGNLTMTGSRNTAVGISALEDNATGVLNTAVGADALRFNTDGERNTAVGISALRVNTTGTRNTAVGSSALDGNTEGSRNTAVGIGALQDNTNGERNTAVGTVALGLNSVGENNTAIGFKADVAADDLTNATAIGANALVDASNKIRLGDDNVTEVETTGEYHSTSGGFRFPDGTLQTTAASGATGDGHSLDAVDGNPTDAVFVDEDGNVGIGTSTPKTKLDIESGNVLLDNNRFLQGETSNGIKINLIGLTGLDVQIGNTSATFNHVRFIRGTVTNMIVTSAGRVGIGTTNPSEKLHVNGNALADAHTTPSSRRWKTNIQTIENPLEKVKHLRGVTYDWKESGKHDIGLIAEEVGEVIPEIVAYEENGTDAKSVDYSRLVAVLIEAVKEQQKTIHELKKDHKQLATQIDRLEIQLSQASLGNK